MCFQEQSNMLVITSGQTIKAKNHVTGSVLWEFSQNVDDKLICPYGLCYNVDGRVYAADGVNEQVIVLNGKTGRFIQTLSAAGSGGMYDEYWRSEPPQLTVHHGYTEESMTTKMSSYEILD